MNHAGDVEDWAWAQFGGVDLGDERRNRRLVIVAKALASHPGSSLPKLFPRWSDLKAVYQLFKREEAILDRIEGDHWRQVLDSSSSPGTYLFVQDTTYLDYTSHQSVSGLGRIGDDGGRGFVQHSTLCLRVEGETADGDLQSSVLGLAHQKLWTRDDDTYQGRESRSDRLRRQDRESMVWSECIDSIGSAPSNDDVEWLLVGDRASDVYETLVTCRAHGFGFVLRACQDRAVYIGPDSDSGGPGPVASNQRLFSWARSVPSLGEFRLKLRARPGRPSREAVLHVGSSPVFLRPPWRPGRGLGSGSWEKVWVVRIWEDPGEGVSHPLEWILLTSVEAEDFKNALMVCRYYQSRWVIEDFHKCMKTGLGVESHQLKGADRLEALIALCAIVSVRLLALQYLGRIRPEAPVELSGFPAVWLDLLYHWYSKNRHVNNWDLETLIKALGNLGGHLGRRRDGPPGWQSLWAGWLRLQDMALGVEICNKEFG